VEQETEELGAKPQISALVRVFVGGVFPPNGGPFKSHEAAEGAIRKANKNTHREMYR